jgi:tetratricopeptide (TPR) repeat protein
MYLNIGDFDRALQAAQQAMRLDPDTANSYSVLVGSYLGLNRFDEARAVAENAIAKKHDSGDVHGALAALAFMNHDLSGLQRQSEWAKNRPERPFFIAAQSSMAIFDGKLHQGLALNADAVAAARQQGMTEVISSLLADRAGAEAMVGEMGAARQSAVAALNTGHSRTALPRLAAILALCGDARTAESLLVELKQRFPQDTLVNNIGIPLGRAAIDLARGDGRSAVEQLKPALAYELGSSSGEAIPYLRGLAYLRASDGAGAGAEFQKVLNHRGVGLLALEYPLAYLGLARANVLKKDAAAARKNYQDFLALWKDADPDIPILREAKQEYAQLK